MIDYSRISKQAKRIASDATSDEVKELASVVVKLIEACEATDRTAEAAKLAAKKNKR